MNAWLRGVFFVCLLASATDGAARAQTVTGSLAITPARLDFGENAVGSESQSLLITISNPGSVTERM